jgi:aldehyde dehydrogenase (NAD+)
MPDTFTHTFNTAAFKGKTSFDTGLFINGKFVDGSGKGTIDVINPTTGELITKVSEGTPADVDIAVKAAQKAFDTTWGLHSSGGTRSKCLFKLAELMEARGDEIAAVEALDNGKPFSWAKGVDLVLSLDCIRYYAGWADKVQGKTIETTETKFAYTRHEPIGVCGQIIPWNFPLLMLCWKLGPALATGNVVVLKPSEFTPLTALLVAGLINEAGFPPGVVNIVNGYGTTVGAAISEHMDIWKVAFTGSGVVGRKIMEAAAKSNLKKVSLELGGKGASIVFADADLEQAINWAAFGIFFNQGQVCCAGSRLFVEAKIYDEFLEKFTARVKSQKVGNPFVPDTFQGPQVSQIQHDRIMNYIQSGKSEGATLHHGGERHGNDGFFIQPTIFTDTKPTMKIVKEEIFGPVVVIIKFESDDEVVRVANDTTMGLASAVFTQNLNRAIKVSNALQSGTVWINSINALSMQVPFGGFKSSGVGRELGEYGLEGYTNIKAVHINLGQKM